MVFCGHLALFSSPNLYREDFAYADTLQAKDRLPISETDTMETSIQPIGILQEKPDSTKSKNELVQDPIFFTAVDSINNKIRDNIIELYNDANVEYQDIKLRAGYIRINKKTNLLFAKGLRNKDGQYVQKPIFTQGKNQYFTDSIVFNIKNKKAITYNVKTKENEGYIRGEAIKKENDSVIYVRNFKFTGDPKDHPDYYIYAPKVKIIQNEWIVASRPQLYVSDVPTPFMAPFGMLQLGSTNRQGILFPTYGENQQGFFLQNLGYYLPIGDYVGVKSVFDLYTRGGFGARFDANYRVRYKAAGSLNYSYQLTTQGERGRADYSESTVYRIALSHMQDSKFNPYLTISANVNYSSSEFYSESLQFVDRNNIVNASTASSISISKRWPNKPYSLSLNGNLNQNFQTGITSVTFPSLNFNATRMYPFSPSGSSNGRHWWERISIGYSAQASNTVSIRDSLLFTQEMFDRMKYGVIHNIPIQTNFKVLDHITVTPNVNLTEQWAFKKLEKRWDENKQRVVSDTIDGFFPTRNFNTGVGVSTQAYGILDFGKDSYIQAVRHVLTPSVSYSFSPNYKDDFFGYQQRFQKGGVLGGIETYNPYSLGIYNPSVGGMSNNISISLSNNFEAKIRPNVKGQTPKKVKLLDFINLSTSYNMSAPQFNWSDVSLSTATSFFENRLRLNFNTSYDWYAVNSSGERVDVLYYKTSDAGWFPWRQKGYNLSMSYGLTQADFVDGTTGNGTKNPPQPNTALPSEPKVAPDIARQLYTPSGGTWSVNFSYSFSRYLNPDGSNRDVQNLSFSGNWNPSSRWKLNFHSGWNFQEDDVSFTSFNISRELDSWMMTFNWSPFGTVSTYNFRIAIKNTILQDLKYDKRSSPRDFVD